MPKIEVTYYKGYKIEHRRLFKVINLSDGPHLFHSILEAKDWINERILEKEEK